MAAEYTGTFSLPVPAEAKYIDGAPVVFFQDRALPGPYYNPDEDGFWWGLTGTFYELGCYRDVSLADNLTFSDIQCDTVGAVGTIGKRNYIEFRATISGIFPLAMASRVFNWTSAIEVGNFEKSGIGSFNNQRFWRAWLPMVYDPDNSQWLGIQLHKAQFIQNTELNMSYGEPWSSDIILRAYADELVPPNQRFATIIRHDPEALA